MPSENSAPLWVFTPFVAANIAFSASMPRFRNRAKTCSGAVSRSSRPIRAQSSNQGRSASALAWNSFRSMSRCAPLFSRSTRPGFGVTFASRIKARWASSPISEARFSFRKAKIISWARSESSRALWVRLRAQARTGPPQIRQRRSIGRSSLYPSASITSMSNSRPSASISSMAHIRAFNSCAGASTAQISSQPVNASVRSRAATAIPPAASAASMRRTPSRNARSIQSSRLISPAMFIVKEISVPPCAICMRLCRSTRASRADSTSATVTGRISMYSFILLYQKCSAPGSSWRSSRMRLMRSSR